MEKSAYLEKPLSEFFTLDNKILSTRSADLYSSIDRVSSEPAYLWVLRHPLEVNSDFVGRFLIRMHKIEHANPLLIPIKYHGVDPSGVGFAVLPPLSGNPLTSSARDTVEKERRFMSCLRAVERAHKQGVVFGDLCLASFWVERDGEVSVICPMGSFDAGAVSDGAMPPSETLLYLAPEQGLDDEVAIYSDVFALGVLGYFLFTEGYPYKNPSDPAFEGFDLSKVVPPSQAGHNVPPWVDEIIMRCIEPDYSSRFQSVPEIMAEISEVRRRIVASSELPVKPKKQAILDQSPALVSKESYTGRPVSVDPKEGKAEKRTLGSMSSLRIIAIGIAVFAVSLIAAWRFVSARAPIRSEFQADLSLHRAAVGENEELGRAIDVITEKRMALSEKSKKLEEIVASDDPLAHDFLVRSAIAADSQELRELSEKSIVDRARRLGLPRSAEQVRQWLRTLPKENRPTAYEPLLRSLDTTLPRDARNAELREAYATQAKVTLRISAALALDSSAIGDYQELLSQLVGDSLGIEDAADYSPLALILAHHDLALIFGDDVVQRREELVNKDLLWVLRILAERDDVSVRAFSSLAVERKVLSALRNSFLVEVRDREDLPSEVVVALVRAAAGTINSDDVGAFGRWLDVDSERLLLALCADTADDAVRAEAFDIVAGKSLTSQPAVSLVQWVRKHHWDKRQEFSKAIGVLSNLEHVSPEQVDAAFAVFDQYVKDAHFVKIMLDTRNPLVTRLVVEKYSKYLSLGSLLNLLDHPDKQVRMLTIKGLKDYNDIGALKLIVDHYEREKDSEVRQAYEETFWMIRERKSSQVS